MEKERVLFLCTGNSCRSQMAEAFLRRYASDRFEVFSAGISPKEINPYTYRVMNEIGFDLADHTSKSLDDFLGKVKFDYLITVCDDADKNCPVVWMKIPHRLHWPFEDPAKFDGTDDQKLTRFREIRDLIQAKVKEWASESV
jgi:arsenate reductase